MSNIKPTIVLPAEWAEQDFVQLTWPHELTDWAYMLGEVNACFVNIAREILKQEKLVIVCHKADTIKTLLGDVDFTRIQFVEMPTNDTWARDHGGITVLKDGKSVV